MRKSIGEVIRALRKEREWTQEELAELLGVSGQTVSKWENDASMPDVSMIVPLASVFGVSTDVLFDVAAQSDKAEVTALMAQAERGIYDAERRVTVEGLRRAYAAGREGLKRYPGNVTLLHYCLEKGIALAYPENNCYDAAHADAIYRDCIGLADLVIRHGKNVNDILRAHMIMVLLHAANGNFAQAEVHAKQFPWRVDMTSHEMYAYIAHARRQYDKESLWCQWDTMYHLEAMLDDITQNGCARMAQGQFDDALTCFESVFALIETIFGAEDLLPPLWFRERGDVRLLMAEAYVGKGDFDRAVAEIVRTVDYEVEVRPQYRGDRSVGTPLLREVEHTFYWKHRTKRGYLEQLRTALGEARFAPLTDEIAFQTQLARIDAALADA